MVKKRLGLTVPGEGCQEDKECNLRDSVSLGFRVLGNRA